MTKIKPEKEYLVTFKLYGRGDAIIKATSAKEAKEKWLEASHNAETGSWDVDREGAPTVRLYRTSDSSKGIR